MPIKTFSGTGGSGSGSSITPVIGRMRFLGTDTEPTAATTTPQALIGFTAAIDAEGVTTDLVNGKFIIDSDGKYKCKVFLGNHDWDRDINFRVYKNGSAESENLVFQLPASSSADTVYGEFELIDCVTGDELQLYYNCFDSTDAFNWQDRDGVALYFEAEKFSGVGSGAGGSSEWGAITGVLSDQTDLQSALDDKASLNSNVTFEDIAAGRTSGTGAVLDAALGGTAVGIVADFANTNAANNQPVLKLENVNSSDPALQISNGTLQMQDEISHALLKTDSNGNISEADILDTKGDILVHDGTDYAKVPVGTDGQRLEADSTESTGVKWVTPTSGGTSVSLDSAMFRLDSDVAVSASGVDVDNWATENLIGTGVTSDGTVFTIPANSKYEVAYHFSAVSISTGGDSVFRLVDSVTNSRIVGSTDVAMEEATTISTAHSGNAIIETSGTPLTVKFRSFSTSGSLTLNGHTGSGTISTCWVSFSRLPSTQVVQVPSSVATAELYSLGDDTEISGITTTPAAITGYAESSNSGMDAVSPVNGTITVATTGSYQATFLLANTDADVDIFVGLAVNGVLVTGLYEFQNIAGADSSQTKNITFPVISVSAGDTVSVFARSSTGTDSITWQDRAYATVLSFSLHQVASAGTQNIGVINDTNASSLSTDATGNIIENPYYKIGVTNVANLTLTEFFEDSLIKLRLDASGLLQIQSTTAGSEDTSISGYISKTTNNGYPITDEMQWQAAFGSVSNASWSTISNVAMESDYDDRAVLWINVQNNQLSYRVTITGMGLSKVQCIVERFDSSSVANGTKITF